jgi:hypothetical protein
MRGNVQDFGDAVARMFAPPSPRRQDDPSRVVDLTAVHRMPTHTAPKPAIDTTRPMTPVKLKDNDQRRIAELAGSIGGSIRTTSYAAPRSSIWSAR